MSANKSLAKVADKYVTFEVAKERYATEALRVHSIIRLGTVTRLPGAHETLLGFVNVRSAIIPLICLRRLFGLPPKEATRETRVIVIERGNKFQGMLVDRVLDVLEIDDVEEIDGVSVPVEVDQSFFSSFFRCEEQTYALMDVNSLLASVLG